MIVVCGEALIDSHVAVSVLDEFRRISQFEPEIPTATASEEMEQLTEAEMAVLRLLAQGADNRTIADRLSLAEKTVSNRLSDIYQKLHVNNRTQAVLYALRRGWVTLTPDE